MTGRGVAHIVGARPQFIKLGPVSRALREAGIPEVVIHTGQHYDYGMSDVFFEELQLRQPDITLGVGSGPHGCQTGLMLQGIEESLVQHPPAWVLVYGDTNSTLAGSLAAAKLHIPLAHIEAGLRSFNRRMPEEINRIVSDAVSDLLLTPTAAASDNLLREGQPRDRIHCIGDVMYDAALLYAARSDQVSRILPKMGLNAGGFILATIHRAENTDDLTRLACIIHGLNLAARLRPVILPLHPRTRKVLAAAGLDTSTLKIIAPVGYLDMIALEKNAALIVTDSGGVQKEAFFYGVPCVTVREETEWVELVELGWNRLCPPRSAEAVADGVATALGSAGRPSKLYGDGASSLRIPALLRL